MLIVEKVQEMLGGNTPALRLCPATLGPHLIALLAYGITPCCAS
jgi:hypothetical protein